MNLKRILSIYLPLLFCVGTFSLSTSEAARKRYINQPPIIKCCCKASHFLVLSIFALVGVRYVDKNLPPDVWEGNSFMGDMSDIYLVDANEGFDRGSRDLLGVLNKDFDSEYITPYEKVGMGTPAPLGGIEEELYDSFPKPIGESSAGGKNMNEVALRIKDKEGHVLSEKKMAVERYQKKNTFEDVRYAHSDGNFSVVDFLNDLTMRIDEHTDIGKVMDFIDMMKKEQNVTDTLYGIEVLTNYTEGVQEMLSEKGCERLSKATLDTLYEEAARDGKRFMRLIQQEASRLLFENIVRGKGRLPREVYTLLVEEPMLRSIDHEHRRRLSSLEFEVCVPWTDWCVTFDLLEHIDKALEKIWGFVEKQIDAVVKVFFKVKEVIDACLTCSLRKPPSFVNVYDIFFTPFLVSFYLCFFCCVFCCSGYDPYGGCCYTIAILTKYTRAFTCKLIACFLICLALPLMCQRWVNKTVKNHCISRVLYVPICICACPGFSFDICSRPNYGLESYRTKCSACSWICDWSIKIVKGIVFVLCSPCICLESANKRLQGDKFSFTKEKKSWERFGKASVTTCFCLLYFIFFGVIALVATASVDDFGFNIDMNLFSVSRDALEWFLDIVVDINDFGSKNNSTGIAKASDLPVNDVPGGVGVPINITQVTANASAIVNKTRRLIHEEAMKIPPMFYPMDQENFNEEDFNQ